MESEINKIERLFFSDSFSGINSYSSEFDLFKMMGVRSKELVHSNIIACLLNPSYSHGLNHLFLNAFTKGISGLEVINSMPIPLSTLISATNNNVRVSRELENIDLVIEYPEAKMVIAIENKIRAGEQPQQIERYQATLKSRYSGYAKALIYLTQSGKKPETLDINSEVPVYCMSYEQLTKTLSSVKSRASKSALFFIEQFISHVEQYMSGSNEIRDLCWELFQKHEDAYMNMVKSHTYCLSKKMKEIFSEIENKVKHDSMFSDYSNNIEVNVSYLEDKKNIIKCDLNLRIKSWPDGLWVKVYKHGWFGVFPFVSKVNLPNVIDLSKNLSNHPNAKIKWWDDKYYVSSNTNLDSERKILSSGNELSKDHVNIALNKVLAHILEINDALK